MSQHSNPFKTSTEKPILAVIDVPWYGLGLTGPSLFGSPERFVEVGSKLSSYDLDVMHVKSLSFQYVEAEVPTYEAKTVEDVYKVNGLIYNKTMNAFRQGQIPIIVGGNNSVSFAAIEAATRKVSMMDVLNISPRMNMENNLETNEWSPESAMFNVAARISNIGNIIQVGAQSTSAEEMEFCDSLNMARIQNETVSGILSGIGKTYPKVWIHFDQDLIRNQFQGKTWLRQCNNIAAPLREWVWISVDLQLLNNKSNVLNLDSLVFLLKTVVKSGHKIVGFDLVNSENVNINAVSGLLHKIAGFAAISHGITKWQPTRHD